jgi:RNA polymerase sigma factor (sigma-70 family)
VGDSESQALETDCGQATDEQIRALIEAIKTHEAELRRDARFYVYKFGPPDDIHTFAEDVLQDALMKALDIAARFDTSRPARPWLRTIIMNMARTACKKRRTERKYIQPVTDAARGVVAREDDPNEFSEDHLFGLLGAASEAADQAVDDGVEETLALVNESDREVLRLAICEGFQGADLASRLGISTGAAYVRKCRAIERLKQAFKRSHSGQEGT